MLPKENLPRKRNLANYPTVKNWNVSPIIFRLWAHTGVHVVGKRRSLLQDIVSTKSYWCDHSNQGFFLCYCLLYWTRLLSLFSSLNTILKCDHSNERYWAVLSCGAVNYAVEPGWNVSVLWRTLKCGFSFSEYACVTEWKVHLSRFLTFQRLNLWIKSSSVSSTFQCWCLSVPTVFCTNRIRSDDLIHL